MLVVHGTAQGHTRITVSLRIKETQFSDLQHNENLTLSYRVHILHT
jgi:capsular polysaccharide biosynthesis protein